MADARKLSLFQADLLRILKDKASLSVVKAADIIDVERCELMISDGLVSLVPSSEGPLAATLGITPEGLAAIEDHDAANPPRSALKQFTLGDLVAALDAVPQEQRHLPVELSVGGSIEKPWCRRADFHDLAFERCERGRTVEEILSEARSAIGETFERKGGSYTMEAWSKVWVSSAHAPWTHDFAIMRASREGEAVVLWVAELL